MFLLIINQKLLAQCEIPGVNITYTFNGNRIGCESGEIEVCLIIVGSGNGYPFYFSIPNSLSNASYTEVDDFNNSGCDSGSFCSNFVEPVSDGYTEVCFKIELEDLSKQTEVPIKYFYSTAVQQGISCSGPPIIIPAIQTITGTTLLTDVNQNIGDLLLPSNLSATQPQWVRITGNLIIDEDYTFGTFSNLQNSNIIMGDDARITVNNGVTFNLRSAYIHGCEKLWDRIDVTLGGQINMQRNLIEDSRNGIQLDNSEVGDQVIVNNNFKNNAKGVVIPSKSTPRIVKNVILGNEFVQKSQLLETVNATIGIEVNDMSNSLIQATILVAPAFAALNKFQNNTNGIQANKLGLLLFQNSNLFFGNYIANRGFMSNILVAASGNTKLWSSHNTYVFKWITGNLTVRNVESTLLRGFGIENDDLDQNFIEYKSTVSDNTLIEQNYVGFNHNGINLFLNPKNTLSIKNHETISGPNASMLYKRDNMAGTSLLINNSIPSLHPSWLIRNNTFDSYPSNNPLNFTDPVVRFSSVSDVDFLSNRIIGQGYNDAIRATGGFRNTMNCNDISFVNNGIYLEAIPHSSVQCNDAVVHGIGLNILGDCDKSYIKSNALQSGSTDLVYGASNFQYAITGPQPADFNYLHGNVFTGTLSSGYGAIDYNSNKDNSIYSKFLADPNITGHFPSFSSIYNGWFTQSNLSTFNCKDPNFAFECSDASLTNDDINLSSYHDLLDSLDFSASGRWNIERRMYDWYRANGMNNSTSAFVGSQTSDPMRYFYDLDSLINGVTGLFQTQIQDIDVAIDSIATLIDTSSCVDVQNAILFYSPTVRYLELKSALDSLSTIRFNFQANRQDTIGARIPALISFNYNISTTVLPQTNQKYYNRIYLNYLLNDSITALDSTYLSSIALQCPITGGRAVYQAQSLLGGLYDLHFTNECSIYERESKPANVVSKSSKIDHYTLYNYLGMPIRQFTNSDIKLVKEKLIFDQSLISGIYILIGYSKTSIVSTEKIFVR